MGKGVADTQPSAFTIFDVVAASIRSSFALNYKFGRQRPIQTALSAEDEESIFSLNPAPFFGDGRKIVILIPS